MDHLGYQGEDRDPEDDQMELELWFGSPENPFRFQGEYDGPPRPKIIHDEVPPIDMFPSLKEEI